uniref:Protein FAR1-related sequence 5-like n=1 Tax=Tanacetum cinerariifolium TaxID=118510 RepID=A0A6L2NVD2_TANCI|nr:protein FAR1-related sequence 5-like [Tanacetum cinerariifolium]
MNLNNMELSRARSQLHFDDYIFIHRASLSNLGPTRAHRVKVALEGGYDKVRGTSTDYFNFRRAVNLFIEDMDAQMLEDRMCKRKKHVPEFSFEYHTLHSKELVRIFWVDETMKCNYVAFGDVVSFDATFDTNKYGYKFVPFTGIDHNQKCVTFGVALLSNETTESFCWMLEAFLKTHKKQPPFAVTDQDIALRNAIVKMFHELHHQLCMWHITQKLPGSEIPMCGLMKTTSRSESSNAFFQIYSHAGNTLVQFMLCFESAMEKQRYTQRVLDNASSGSNPSMFTELPFEKHASDVYTPAIFRENVLPAHLLDKRHRYDPCIEEIERLASDIHSTIEDCISLFRNDSDKLSEFLSTVKDLKKKLKYETQVPNVEPNKDDLYFELLDVSIPNKVVIKTPKSIFRSKDTREIKSAAEIGKAKTISRSNTKVPFKWRTCSACGGKGHNKETCKGCSACGKPVDDEDEGDTEDELADEDEVDEEYESDEE